MHTSTHVDGGLLAAFVASEQGYSLLIKEALKLLRLKCILRCTP